MKNNKVLNLQFTLNAVVYLIGIIWVYFTNKFGGDAYLFFYMYFLMIYLTGTAILEFKGIFYDRKKLKSKTRKNIMIAMFMIFIFSYFIKSTYIFLQSLTLGIFAINIVEYLHFKKKF